MKRNFEVIVKDHEGRAHIRRMDKYDESGMPMIENGAPVFDKFVPMTLRQYALDALAGRWKGEENISHEESWKRMKLHDKLAFSLDGEVELNGEEGKMILDAMNHSMKPPVVIGRMKNLLDTDPDAKKDDPK